MTDDSQYTLDSIALYESIYGKDFISPGGAATARNFIRKLALKEGALVLDVGCGLGGSAFMMAREFGLIVDGIDLSHNMVKSAMERCTNYALEAQVKLTQGDCLELEHENHYDAIYSRDVFLHIPDKERLFGVLHRALKPGGRLLFTDYCCGPTPWSDEFSNYVSARGYALKTPAQYADLIASAGFEHVSAEDLTAEFITLLEAEQSSINKADLSPGQRQQLLQSWQNKIHRAKQGDHRWGLVNAIKPG